MAQKNNKRPENLKQTLRVFCPIWEDIRKCY